MNTQYSELSNYALPLSHGISGSFETKFCSIKSAGLKLDDENPVHHVNDIRL